MHFWPTSVENGMAKNILLPQLTPKNNRIVIGDLLKGTISQANCSIFSDK